MVIIPMSIKAIVITFVSVVKIFRMSPKLFVIQLLNYNEIF